MEVMSGKTAIGSACVPPHAAYLLQLRPEGPTVNSTERPLGVGAENIGGPKGRHKTQVPHLRCSLFVQSYPGLTAGPINCRSFGPSASFLQKLCDIRQDAGTPGQKLMHSCPDSHFRLHPVQGRYESPCGIIEWLKEG
jgi:hypothetical protein